MINCHILIAEDSLTQAEALRDLLQKNGARVEVASSAEAALERLVASDDLPDLVLSDVVMPGLSGYDLTRRIKADDRLDRVPVVLLTSLTDPLDIVRGLECGADNYVTKPYDPEYLVARLRHVLGQKRFSRGLRASMGVNVQFLGTTFMITSEREQILDLFLSSVEDVVRTNSALEQSQQELAEAQRQLETYARQMAARAHTSSERLRAVIEAAPMAIIAIDAAGKVTLWNAAAERILGWTEEDVIDQPLRMAPKERKGDFARDIAKLAAGETIRIETEVTAKDGRLVDVRLSAGGLRDVQGAPEGSMAIIEDITEQKRTARALEASQAHLVQAQKMEAIGALAGGIAHDFNNLLTIMRSYSAMLIEDLPEGDNDHRHSASEILAAADRAAALTRQLLSFSRKQVLEPRLVRPDEVLGGIQQMLRRLVPTNIDMTFRLHTGESLVRIDPGQLEQVLMNLVINASHAMPQGGKVDVSTQTVRIGKGQTPPAGELAPGSYVVLAVSDTGIGMSEETQKKLFEPFFTTKPAGIGTGLGLSIVRRIVSEQKGAIAIRSVVGQGTTFDVYLPVSADPVPRPSAPATAVPTGNEVILVVDDDEPVRTAVRMALERFGYTVLEAHDGDQALRVAEMLSAPPDLLLTDLMMPNVSGRELIDMLARNGNRPKVLVMSGYAGDETTGANGVAAIRHPFIQKPFTRESLAQKVREVLDCRPNV